MIQHFLEVWLFLVTAFALGCVVGAAIYTGLAATFFAPVQVAMARGLRYGIDGILERVGATPAWREYQYVPADEPESVDEEETRPRLRRPRSTPVRADFEEVQAGNREAVADEDGPSEASAATLFAARGPTPMRPSALSRPRKGVPDDLQRIRGIGKKTERMLNELGIFHFGQIAAWTPGEARWISERMAFPERIEQDDWIGQAVMLASDDAAGVERGLLDSRRDRDPLFLDAAEFGGVDPADEDYRDEDPEHADEEDDPPLSDGEPASYDEDDPPYDHEDESSAESEYREGEAYDDYGEDEADEEGARGPRESTGTTDSDDGGSGDEVEAFDRNETGGDEDGFDEVGDGVDEDDEHDSDDDHVPAASPPDETVPEGDEDTRTPPVTDTGHGERDEDDVDDTGRPAPVGDADREPGDGAVHTLADDADPGAARDGASVGDEDPDDGGDDEAPDAGPDDVPLRER